MAEPHDPRITPARPDLAAADLRGQVTAQRYVTASPMQVCAFAVPLHLGPDRETPWLSELLLGERFDVFERNNGWAWGQAERDHYVGYVPLEALAPAGAVPDQRISTLRTPVFAKPDLKAPVFGFAHHLSCFAQAGQDGDYVRIAPGGGWVYGGHCEPVTAPVRDWVEAALLYLHAPYVWGGRSSFGLDCSALVQNALQAGGVSAPRDSDMQAQTLGSAVPFDADLGGLRRGDLVFWSGHAGLMLDATDLLHANAHHMGVAREPLIEAARRIARSNGPVTAIKRIE